jgi:hypothetical protein
LEWVPDRSSAEAFGFRCRGFGRIRWNVTIESVREQSHDGANYNENVARGWESKSVEAQQAEASDKSVKPRPKLTPEAAARARDRETLLLSRKTVLQQLESSKNPRHQKLLRDALHDLDEKLRLLGA